MSFFVAKHKTGSLHFSTCWLIFVTIASDFSMLLVLPKSVGGIQAGYPIFPGLVAELHGHKGWGMEPVTWILLSLVV